MRRRYGGLIIEMKKEEGVLAYVAATTLLTQ
jgi:hypothetical protein